MLGGIASCALMSLLSFAGLLLVGKKKSIPGFVESSCLALAASTMVADSLLHLIPEAIEQGDQMTMVVAYLGALSVVVFEYVCSCFESKIEPFGWANLLTEALHNAIDGASIGVAWATSTSAGIAATIAVAVHELPQELGDFVVLQRAGFETSVLIAYNFAVSLTSFVGLLLANSLVGHHLLAFTAGSFLALALYSIAPQVLKSLDEHNATLPVKLLCFVLSLSAAAFLYYLALLEHHHDAHSHHDHHHHDDLSPTSTSHHLHSSSEL